MTRDLVTIATVKITMAADVEVELPFVGTRGLEGTLVAPRTTKPVPNHLSDTSKHLKDCSIN